MSASIYFKPVKPTANTRLNVGAPSTFIKAMERAFGHFPCLVNRGNIEKLKGMASMYDCRDSPFEELINLLEHHEALELWAEY